jgi:hypothetical protein
VPFTNPQTETKLFFTLQLTESRKMASVIMQGAI